MSAHSLIRILAILTVVSSAPALAQDSQTWQQPQSNGNYDTYNNSSGRYSPGNSAPSNSAPGNWGQSGNSGQDYGGRSAATNDAYTGGGRNDAYNGGGSNDAYSPNSAGRGYDTGRGSYSNNDAYSPPRTAGRSDGFSDPGEPVPRGGGGGYGEPYSAPPPAAGSDRDYAGPGPREDRYYNQGEIIAAGHGFFGAVSKNLAGAVEYAFRSQGRPNGYILGEDAGGAFVVGLCYGEGMLYTKDAGDHKVYWQGPSFGYDAGAEGSKTMVLVYNLRDPSEIYHRFGGVQGSAYLVGGLSVQFQTYGDVTLGVIRSGVGVRLGANVGYLKYTRAPTWNPL